MLECMNHLASLDLVSLDALVAMGFHNPLKLIGLAQDDAAQARDVRFDKKDKVFCVQE
jgi:hypothetical protein